MKSMKTLYKVIEDKTIAWFENTNKYVVLENTTADILKRLSKGISVEVIANALSKKIEVPLEKAEDFIINLKKKLYEPNNNAKKTAINDDRDIKKPSSYNNEDEVTSPDNKKKKQDDWNYLKQTLKSNNMMNGGQNEGDA